MLFHQFTIILRLTGVVISNVLRVVYLIDGSELLSKFQLHLGWKCSVNLGILQVLDKDLGYTLGEGGIIDVINGFRMVGIPIPRQFADEFPDLRA